METRFYYDVIVVGAGIMGSCTAHHLSKTSRLKVVILEQFSALHSRGSSNDACRMIRKGYVEAFYVKMMEEAYKLWAEIETDSGTQLYTQTGYLDCGAPSGYNNVNDTENSLRVNGLNPEVLTGEKVNNRYSGLLNLPPNFKAVYDKDGGVLAAGKALRTIQNLFLQNGGTLLDNHQVTDIQSDTDGVTVVTNQGVFRGKKLILTPGSWGPAMCKQLGLDLPLKVIKGEQFYWKVDDPDVYSASRFPCVTYSESPDVVSGHRVYCSMPVLEYPGLMKIMLSHGGKEVDPSHRDKSDPTPHSLPLVQAYIKKFFRGVSTTPSIFEPCLYTYSPDCNPVVDYHPSNKNIIIATGFTGHGFKLGPVMGRLISDLAVGLTPSHDLSHFRIDRFDKLTHQSKL